MRKTWTLPTLLLFVACDRSDPFPDAGDQGPELAGDLGADLGLEPDAGPDASARLDAEPVEAGAADLGSDAGGSLTPGPRQHHAATALGDGHVLLTGGLGEAEAQSETWIFDPVLDTWQRGAILSPARSAHHAVLLDDGTVLIVGGARYPSIVQPQEIYRSAVVYDPISDSYRDVGSMSSIEGGLWARRVPSGPDTGKVLVGGHTPGLQGTSLTFELFDPAEEAFVEEKVVELPAYRFTTAGAMLDDGRFLIVGGTIEAGGSANAHSSVLLFDWSTGQVAPAQNEMDTPRAETEIAKLADGRLLIVGGTNRTSGQLDTAELFDPKTNSFSATTYTMSSRRRVHSVVQTSDDRVFVFGGFASGMALDSIESWTESDGFASASQVMPASLGFMTATPLPDGRVLLLGGQTSLGGVVGTYWIFSP